MKFFDCNCIIGRRSIYHAEEFFSAEDLLKEMAYTSPVGCETAHGAGIAEALVYHALAKEYSPEVGNQRLLSEIKGHKELHPCWVILPHHTGEMRSSEQLIAEMFSQGVKAVRLFPVLHSFSLKEWCCGELLEAMARHKVLLFIELEQASWEDVYSLCRQYPTLPVVLTNLSYRINRQIYPLLERFDNLYLEISGYQVHRGLEDITQRFGAGHLLFGSRMPFFTPGSSLMLVNYANIGQKDKELIAGDNLRRLLREVE